MKDLLASLRYLLVTLVVCSGVYPLVLLAFAQGFFPESAQGSLVRRDGKVVGSRLIAQGFARPTNFWPRPSAVDYDAAAAGGSNLSPAHPALRERAAALLARPGFRHSGPVPVELVQASGSGLDPHLSLAATRYQISRVAAARGLDPERVARLVDEQAFAVGLGAGGELVNVLELNLALDALDEVDGGR